jgi:histidyl-tRNA synthetase
MATKLQAPKGTLDTLPADVGRWQAIEQIARDVAATFNFKEIRTPIFEHSELFHRGVGETSDVIKKETYTFEDRGGRSITLRPEGTAGVVRAMIEHGFVNDQGARAKVYYLSSNFRYERPAAGRYRVHHQFGVEAFGVAEPEQDVECMLLQLAFYKRAGLRDLALKINSLGDRETKSRFSSELVNFFTPKRSALSEDSQRRLDENPLRILDSKDPRDIVAREGAPSATDSLSDRSRAHFERVTSLLQQAGATFAADPLLVRGFDYYTDTLWEVTASGLGAQDAVGGGGRYDNLVEQLGGRPTPGVGFGSGLERLLLALEAQQVALPILAKPLIWIAYHGDAAKAEALSLTRELRDAGLRVDLDLTGKAIKGQFKLAEKEAAAIAVTLGEQEIADRVVQVKTLATREQVTVARPDLAKHLAASSS